MNILTFDMILELPNIILSESKKYDKYAQLLRKDIYDKYDIKDTRKKVEKYFNRYKDVKYLYKFPFNYNITSSSFNVTKVHSGNNDKTSLAVAKNVDEQIWAYDFYECLVNLSPKLTEQESIYLVDTFFSGISEEIISEKLNICRNTLQNIKKSCIVKTWFAFQDLN